MGAALRLRPRVRTLPVSDEPEFLSDPNSCFRPEGSFGEVGLYPRAEGEGEMNRLRRFYESAADSRTGRVVYATSTAALARWLPDAVWIEDTKFNAGDAILADPSLKDTYKEAILHGCAMAKGK